MKKKAVLLNYTGRIDHHGCQVVSSNLVSFIQSAGYAVHKVDIGRDWQSSKKMIRGSSMVIINGEGTMHHSSPFALRLLKAARYCESLRVPVFLVNSVWQENSPRSIRMSKSLSKIFVRESHSLRSLKSSGLNGEMVPDLSFATGIASFDNLSRSNVMVSDSVDRSVTKILFSVHQSIPGSKFISLRPARDDVSSVADVEPLEVSPKIISRFRSFSLRAFVTTLLVRIASIFDTSFQLATRSLEKLTFNDLINNLMEARIVVTGRFHLVCFCILTGTPFIATASNSHKIQGLLEDAKLTHRFVEPARLPKALESLPVWTQSDTERCQYYVAQARKSQVAMFETLFNSRNPRDHVPNAC